MPSPYLDDDGEPRYGRRASPEELEASAAATRSGE